GLPPEPLPSQHYPLLVPADLAAPLAAGGLGMAEEEWGAAWVDPPEADTTAEEASEGREAPEDKADMGKALAAPAAPAASIRALTDTTEAA
ncbi:hypothetical protein JCM6882_003923, partial [Rhodosporidiobolus microsporus]